MLIMIKVIILGLNGSDKTVLTVSHRGKSSCFTRIIASEGVTVRDAAEGIPASIGQ